MEYLTAWIIVGVAGLGALAGVFVLSRQIPWPLLRTIVRCLAAVFFLVPAPIGVLEGFYAPAFVVLVFEGLFRDGGSAEPALTMLAIASAAALLLVALGYIVNRRRAQTQPEPE